MVADPKTWKGPKRTRKTSKIGCFQGPLSPHPTHIAAPYSTPHMRTVRPSPGACQVPLDMHSPPSISKPQGSSRSFQQLPALVKSLGIRCRPPHLATSQRNTTRRRIRCQPGSRVTRFSITNFPVAFARFACSAASWCMMPTTSQVQSHSSTPFPAFGGRAKAVASSFRPSLKQPPLHLPRPAGITR